MSNLRSFFPPNITISINVKNFHIKHQIISSRSTKCQQEKKKSNKWMNQFFQWPTERPILCSLAEKSRTSEEQASLTVVYWPSKLLYDEIICYCNYKKKKELYIYSNRAGNLFNSGTNFFKNILLLSSAFGHHWTF